MEFKLELYDPDFNRTYVITLDQEDYIKACNDQAYASALLNHSRACFNQPTQTLAHSPKEEAKKIALTTPKTSIALSPSTSTTTEVERSSERSVWTRGEILLVIDLYRQNQDLFKSTTTRKDVFWGEICEKMKQQMECNKSADQCRNKFKYLKTMYLKKKDNMSTRATGSQKIYFQFFNEMDVIFKDDHNVTPVAIVSSFTNNFPAEENCEKNEENDDENIPGKKKRKLLVNKEKPVIKILSKRETNAERRHQENLQKKNEALDLCRQILDLAQNIVEPKKYLVCKSNRKYGCKASAKLVITEERNDVIMINANHNHAAPESDITQLNFKEALKDACLRERGDLKSIYEKIAKRPSDAFAEAHLKMRQRWLLLP
ncbi:unnamed protein product [Ceutorhynchus assimilis]|uniref:Myb-like domain-containing protein n=1 Tax=Ceutorhynchus assimilis TaxID=467358 RepID=A0A9N9MJF8_9CUCU|nr:unnamed protein product [Ceutorhynchus assimilis]